MSATAARPARRWLLIAAGIFAALIIGVGLCEATGWPFLVAPMQHWLATTLHRRVSFSEDPATQPRVVIRLLGRIRIIAGTIEIGAPAWSQAPHMLRAQDARLTLGYVDLWRASRGAPLRVHELRAARLDGELERLADGRASWQFGDKPAVTEPAGRLPEFGRLEVDAGKVVYRDAVLAIDLDGRFSLVEGTARQPATAASGATGLQFEADGTYRKAPMKIGLQAAGVLPVMADDAGTVQVPVTLEAHAGGGRLTFKGTATDALHLGAMKGRFDVQGPSLAAVGDALGVTLPTTGPFRMQGLVAKQGVVWNVVADAASVGASRLAGAFTYDPRPRVPLLSGRLTGSRLLLADLGPAVGAPARKTAASGADAAASAVRSASAASAARAASTPTGAAAPPRRVLPDRPFDLPSLRAMDANVLVDIDHLDLGSSILEPLRPLRTHLTLADGVLLLRDLDARTGQGRLGGAVQLDGRADRALWSADLRWAGVQLERWIHQARAKDAPPYATGILNGQARVNGQGRSTAAILASLQGSVRMHLVNGTISHLAVEAAGLDIAQALGVMVKGDDALPVQCSVVDLAADKGLLRPRVLVLDTPDSTLWVDGSLSLATEALDLRVVVVPKDFSPMSLRTPLRLRGSFAQPSVSLESGRLAPRLGASALLALINPLAALIPLFDPGGDADAKRSTEQCQALAKRFGAQPVQLPAAPRPQAAKAARAPATAR